MIVLNSQQIKEAERLAMQAQGITSWQLMERAAEKLFQWIKAHCQREKHITVLAGTGNNGGDGLALARMLLNDGRNVTTYLLHFSAQLSPDCQQNKELLQAQGHPVAEIYPEQADSIHLSELVIDAIFGIGLNRPAPQWLQQLFARLNASSSEVLSVDMPSGLPADAISIGDARWVHPKKVLTFQNPKLPFLLPTTGQYIPDWEVLDIGIETQCSQVFANAFPQAAVDAKICRKERAKFSHKGSYGHALLVGGSYGKIGAVVLSATDVLRAGAGLLTVAIPQCGYTVLQTAVPEAMAITSEEEKHFKTTEIPFSPSAIGVGIGWGTHPETAEALFALFERYPHTPFVIDADALNILSQHPEKHSLLPKGAILTPHPKELQRLIGTWKDDFEKLDKAKAFAAKHQVVLLIKGAYTAITEGQHYWFNFTGNAGMATAGSGDVLTGMLTGLYAQGYTALQTALLGVKEHGRQGDAVAQRIGMHKLIARDLIC